MQAWSPVDVRSAVQPQESHLHTLGLSFHACKMGWLSELQSAQQRPLVGQWHSMCADHRRPTYRAISHLETPGRPAAEGQGTRALRLLSRGTGSPSP